MIAACLQVALCREQQRVRFRLGEEARTSRDHDCVEKQLLSWNYVQAKAQALPDAYSLGALCRTLAAVLHGQIARSDTDRRFEKLDQTR
jgi:hypothetical protein